MGAGGVFREEEASVVGEGAVEGVSRGVGWAGLHRACRLGKDSQSYFKWEGFKAG